MSLLEDQANCEAGIRDDVRRCLLCERDASIAVWWQRGCYTAHGLPYCDACIETIRANAGGKKQRRKDFYHEQPYTQEDRERIFQKRLAERPHPPYRSTVSEVA